MLVQGKVMMCQMNQNQIWLNLNTGIHYKLDPDKLSSFKGISQGFLEDETLRPIQTYCSEN